MSQAKAGRRQPMMGSRQAFSGLKAFQLAPAQSA
jgi:hypothetical protein